MIQQKGKEQGHSGLFVGHTMKVIMSYGNISLQCLKILEVRRHKRGRCSPSPILLCKDCSHLLPNRYRTVYRYNKYFPLFNPSISFHLTSWKKTLAGDEAEKQSSRRGIVL
jgi:hypothetical protein